jgi:drug/metabolite transporter (DMT)-like permease
VSEPSRFRLGLAYGAICVIWGSTYLAIKVGLESFSPMFYAGVRYTLAAALAFAVARASGVAFAGPLRRWLPVAGIGVLLIAVSNGLVFWSETRLDSGFTALLLTTSPLWSALLSPMFPGEPGPRALGWIGIVVGFAGTVVMFEPWRAGAVPLLPAVAAELSVVTWTVGSLWARRIRGTFQPMAISVAQMAAGAVVLLAISLVEGRAMVGPLTVRAAASLAYLVVVGSVVAFAAYFYLLQHWGATRVATSTYVNPVVAVILGAVLLSEAVTWSMVAGALVVFAGVTLVLRDQQTVARAERRSPGAV